ncbi:MAG: DUF3035 domain-containing protein [Alphaproteobacteria bacterium]|nr:MAG: DUF3035 domain-containing protein [Alphaproteobacteria bacterium]
MNLKSASLLLAACVSVAACGGNGKIVPDEFQVVDRAPLVVPPEAELSPPRPGQPRAQEIDPGRQAFEALFPGATYTPSAPKSRGENELLSHMLIGDPDVRSNAGQEKLDVVKKTLLLADLLESDEHEYRPDNVEIRRTSGNN